MRSALTFFMVAYSALASGGPSAAPDYRSFVPADPVDALPPWRYLDMVETVVTGWKQQWTVADVEEVEVLAWYAMVDDRPLYVNEALLCLRLTRGRWALAQLAQNPIPDPHVAPQKRDAGTRWNYHVIFDMAWQPGAVYSQRPTVAEVDDFLQRWREQRGFRITTEGVRKKTWQRMFQRALPGKLGGVSK